MHRLMGKNNVFSVGLDLAALPAEIEAARKTLASSSAHLAACRREQEEGREVLARHARRVAAVQAVRDAKVAAFLADAPAIAAIAAIAAADQWMERSTEVAEALRDLAAATAEQATVNSGHNEEALQARVAAAEAAVCAHEAEVKRLQEKLARKKAQMGGMMK